MFNPNKLDNADDEEIGLEDDSYNSPVTPPKEKNRSNDNRKRARYNLILYTRVAPRAFGVEMSGIGVCRGGHVGVWVGVFARK